MTRATRRQHVWDHMTHLTISRNKNMLESLNWASNFCQPKCQPTLEWIKTAEASLLCMINKRPC